jgi:YbbR domain-containing protein
MRDLLIKDWAWKSFSLVLAMGIWLVVNANRADLTATETAGARDTVTFEDLPVLVLSSGADVHELKVQPAEVAVTVTGSHDVMSALKEKDVHVTVNVTDIAAKRNSRQLVDVSAPPGVTLVSVEPSSVGLIVPMTEKKP